MKLLIFIPTLSGGGAERVCSMLTLNLSERIERVLVLYENKISYPYKAKLYSMEIPILPDNVSLFLRLKNIIVRLRYLRKIFKEEKPNIVMGFMESANGLLLLCKLLFRFNTKFIVNVRTFPSVWYRDKRILYKLAIKLLYNLADTVIVNSKAVKEDLIQNFKIKEGLIKVIPNFYDLKAIEEAKREEVELPWFNEDIPIIANMGRLNEEKGQDYLLRAISCIKKKINCRLLILGDGPKREELEAEAERLSIRENVKFLGFQHNPHKFLAHCTLFVFPSLLEGFPNALVEAMACGLPVISFDCPSGPSEILQDNRYGILVPLKNEAALKEAILNLLKDEKLRKEFAEKAKERAEYFSKDRIIYMYEKLFS